MNLKKIALATAIAAAPFAANALEALDDEFLGDVTGQEGITIDKEYINTIEEFQYVDADGDGSSGAAAGKIVIGGITIDSNGGNVVETGQTIDATANGVLIGAAAIGTGTGDGKDIRINSIQFGNSSSALNSIGSVTIDDSHNWLTTAVDTTIESVTNVTTTQAALVNLGGTTLISSKTTGTGVVITSESFGRTESITYSDHDGGGESSGNSVSIVGVTSFRLADSADAWDDATNYNLTGATAGDTVRGAYTSTTIDVQGGQLVLAQTKVGSTIIDGIQIGGNSIGSLAILGNKWVGTTKIYAH